MIRVPERAQVGAIERHATVVAPAVRCIDMISSLVNRLCDGEPRKAEDGPTRSASAN